MKKNRRIAKLMEIHCGQCGHCCIDPIIEVTHHDIKRLVKHLGKPADAFVKLFARSDFNNDECENDWIRLSYGYRKLGLKKKQDGSCIFLSPENKCTAYEARPMSCRVFPVDVILDEDNTITDLELSDVIRDKFITCNRYYGKPVSLKKFLEKADQSGSETVSFWKKIQQWNKSGAAGRKEDIIRHLGIKPPRR